MDLLISVLIDYKFEKKVITLKTLIFEIGWIFRKKYKYLGLNNYLKGNLESLKGYHDKSRS